MLWDCLPGGLFLGGAPINVAYHLLQHEITAIPVSSVGDDFLGQEILRRMQGWGMKTDLVQKHPSLPTGAVIAEIDPSGNAHYQILENVAWDDIMVCDQTSSVAHHTSAIIFGSLAQRSQVNQDRLLSLLKQMESAERIFDVNLRPPYDDLEKVRSLAKHASLIKLNHEEAAKLARGTEDDHEANARNIVKQLGVETVCVTCGAQGAGLLRGGEWFWVDGKQVEVMDTVGAGDSFLASLIFNLVLYQEDSMTSLNRACRLGEFMASQSGATPRYQLDSDYQPVEMA